MTEQVEKIYCRYPAPIQREVTKTRAQCEACKSCNIGDCIRGPYWVHKPEKREYYERFLVNPPTSR